MPEDVEIEANEIKETLEEMREEREEREREEKQTAWTRWISLSTSFLAVIAAVAALQSGFLVNEALAVKNDAVLKQAKASDQWAYYQAKGIKSNGAEQTAALFTANPAQAVQADKWKAEAERYKAEQKDIQDEAVKIEKERDKENAESNELMEHHHSFAFSVTFTQVAIALSAVAALTKRKPVWLFSLLIGSAGLIFFIKGFLDISH
jgi:hypothetical protein